VTAHAWTAGPDEADAVAALLSAFRDHLGYDGPADEVFRSGVRRLIADPDTEFLLAAAEPGAPPSGVTQLRFRWGLWRAGGDCLVEDVYVAASARRAGLARALLQLATERARARGCRRMELDVSEANDAALSLYTSFGFRAAARPGAARDLYLRRHLD